MNCRSGKVLVVGVEISRGSAYAALAHFDAEEMMQKADS